MNFLKVMELAKDGDIIQNNFAVQFKVRINSGDKFLDVIPTTMPYGYRENVFSMEQYVFLAPCYDWTLLPQLKDWTIVDGLLASPGNRNRYCVVVEPFGKPNRFVHIISCWQNRLPTADAVTVINGNVLQFDSVADGFIGYIKVHIGDGYKDKPSDYDEFYALVKNVVSY